MIATKNLGGIISGGGSAASAEMITVNPAIVVGGQVRFTTIGPGAYGSRLDNGALTDTIRL